MEIRPFGHVGRHRRAILGSLLAWWVLGPRTRNDTAPGCCHHAQFFGKRYHTARCAIAAAAIIFVFLIPYTASVYNGLSRLFGIAFGLPYEACVIGVALITCIYWYSAATWPPW